METYDEIKARLEKIFDPAQLAATLTQLFGFYVFRQFQRVFYEKLVQTHGLAKVKAMMGSIEKFVRDRVTLVSSKAKGRQLDWRGIEGQAAIHRICQTTYQAFERVQ